MDNRDDDDNSPESRSDDCEDEQRSKPRTRTDSENSDSDSNQEKKQRINLPSLVQHNGFMFPGVPASPPKFISLEQIMEAANGVSNMALAHEIAVNKEFVLEKVEPKSSIEKQVKDVVHKAFWDSFEAKLKETPPDYSHAMVLLGEIKKELMAILLPHHTRLRSQIDEVLDLDLIKQQVDNDALDFHYYARFIVSTMSRLCAPVRDQKIQELMSLTEVVPLYKEILETLQLMKLDMANFAIQQMRPHIQQQSVEYERKKFQEFLEALAALTPPVDGLELTKQWFDKVCDKVMAAKSTENVSASSSTSSYSITNDELIVKAYLEILQWDNYSIFPETLQMDQVRFLALRDQFTTVILTASLLLVTYSIVGEAIQGVTSLKERLKDQLFILLKDLPGNKSDEEQDDAYKSVALQIAREVNQCLQEHGYSALDESKSSLLSAQLQDIRSENHSVRKLITTRILEFVEQVLKTTNAASVKFPPGLSAFHKELSGLAGQFLRLVNHNRAVFGSYYDDIISEARKQKDMLRQHTPVD